MRRARFRVARRRSFGRDDGGGTAKPGCTQNCFLIPTNVQELQQELRTIVTATASITSCTITLNPPPPAPDKVHLVVTESGATYEVPLDTGSGNGWTLAADATSATLTGSICEDAKNAVSRICASSTAVVASISGGDALDRLIQFYPQYSSVLRTDWLTYAGVISDANSTLSASQFSSAFVALNPAFSDWKFAGVVCGRTCDPVCSATASVYQTLATQTGGFAGDFCGLQSAMAGVAASIVEAWTPPCSWNLPAGEALDPRYVNLVYTLPGGTPVVVPYVETAAACGTAPGWSFDDAISPTRMSVCPATCSVIQAEPEATIEIRFGCLTITRPP